mgnify:FL=1
MFKMTTALGAAAALIALIASSTVMSNAGCEMLVLEQEGQLIERVVCDDGSSYELALGSIESLELGAP